MFHTQGVRRSGGALGDTWIRNENQNPKTSKTKSMPSMKYRYVFSDRSGLTRNCVVMVALPFNQMDSIFGTKVGATPLMILICKLSNAFTWCAVPYTTVYITPPGGFPKLDCSTTKRVTIPTDASSESSRRDAVLFGADTVPTVEISTSSGQNLARRPYLIRPSAWPGGGDSVSPAGTARKTLILTRP